MLFSELSSRWLRARERETYYQIEIVVRASNSIAHQTKQEVLLIPCQRGEGFQPQSILFLFVEYHLTHLDLWLHRQVHEQGIVLQEQGLLASFSLQCVFQNLWQTADVMRKEAATTKLIKTSMKVSYHVRCNVFFCRFTWDNSALN